MEREIYDAYLKRISVKGNNDILTCLSGLTLHSIEHLVNNANDYPDLEFINKQVAHLRGEINEFEKSVADGNYVDSELIYDYNDGIPYEKSLKNTVQDEICDIVLCAFVLSAYLGMDLDWHIRQKMEYNKCRHRDN